MIGTAPSGSLETEIQTRLASNEWDVMMAQRVLSARKMQKRKILLAAAIALMFVTSALWLFYPAGTQTIAVHDDLITRQINGTYASVFPEAGSNGNTAPLAELDSIVDAALARR